MHWILRKIHTLLNTKRIFWRKFVGSPFFNLVSDKYALKILYHNEFGRPLNLNNPQTFNEKLQWLKLYNRKPEYTALVDKAAVKEVIASIIGEEHIIPTLGVYDNFEDIDFEALPKQFVLKTTHGGGNTGVVICKDKNSFNYKDAKTKIENSLKTNTYLISREWPYKNVKPRIIAEKFMEDYETKELRDYKFFAMDGVVNAMFVASERNNREEPYFDFFDADFKHLDINQGHPNAPFEIAKPECFNEMKEMASKISKGMPNVRCDFYEVNGHSYFGEITFFHFSGLMPFIPNDVDTEWGKWITLPQSIGGG